MTQVDQIIQALGKLLPGAKFGISSCRDWYSITFAGQQLTIIAELQAAYGLDHAELFASTLPELEFALPGLIVADIAVTNLTNHGENLCLQIDALILNE